MNKKDMYKNVMAIKDALAETAQKFLDDLNIADEEADIAANLLLNAVTIFSCESACTIGKLVGEPHAKVAKDLRLMIKDLMETVPHHQCEEKSENMDDRKKEIAKAIIKLAREVGIEI